MFIVMVTTTGWVGDNRDFFGPYASRKEAREASRKCLEDCLATGFPREQITTEVKELHSLDLQ